MSFEIIWFACIIKSKVHWPILWCRCPRGSPLWEDCDFTKFLLYGAFVRGAAIYPVACQKRVRSMPTAPVQWDPDVGLPHCLRLCSHVTDSVSLPAFLPLEAGGLKCLWIPERDMTVRTWIKKKRAACVEYMSSVTFSCCLDGLLSDAWGVGRWCRWGRQQTG